MHECGIHAHVLVFNACDNARLRLDIVTEEDDPTYLRYLVARPPIRRVD